MLFAELGHIVRVVVRVVENMTLMGIVTMVVRLVVSVRMEVVRIGMVLIGVLC